MESRLPMLNCLLQHTLRNLCAYSDSSTSSKWVYAVFWRTSPRNYPPPKWDYGGGALERSKGNKRNWILVWEDGFCDFYECEQAGSGYVKGRFGADVFFKLSHEVYNYGEGLVGKVAADNSHKWIFRDPSNEGDPSFISSWNLSVEPQPRAWESQFKSGIQTIALISVREGIIQLGSFDKIVEDLNLVINIQRKFTYLQSIPGVFSMQRPYLSIQHHYSLKPNTQTIETHQDSSPLSIHEKRQSTGLKRLFNEISDDFPTKSINLGWNTPQNGISGSSTLWPVPPLLPSMSCSLGALLSKLPSVFPNYNFTEANNDTAVPAPDNNPTTTINKNYSTTEINGGNIKLETSFLGEFQDEKVMDLGFAPVREQGKNQQGAINLN
ncbi:protein RICE SALT SENSITIVE 3 [Cannabis sativa]|uniref:protein RICE SALT SENSITIVE 3 n=1 Tax=Cannabis sativa TaxID=3483 RepID=UPI0029CA3919|nr:protein RICE SALT SENSITIVE 3 [Cannabis sativa]XP_060963112.1 protein RICE SALT SENSITIVE 3 [Cannabis sativa]